MPLSIATSPSASDDSTIPPRTPGSPSMHALPILEAANVNNSPSNQSGTSPGAAQMKRKPSRRANTAERRATHNAVERQRRETLNGRFLVSSGQFDPAMTINLSPFTSGSCRSPPESLSDPSPLQVFHR